AHSAALRSVTTLTAAAAGTRAGVLLRGEEGCGRHLVARAIHERGVTGAFVAVNCGAYESEQLDAALFGASRAKGAAVDDASAGLERLSRRSLLHDALGGTLYLQNVADAPRRVQARLARILRDREALLTETGEPIACDVRPVAGVDMSFEVAVQDGRVREDLFRRLSTVIIDLPPLRHRHE